MSSDVFSIPLNRIDGSSATLQDYAGDVLLVVNVASECGLTPQYQGLQSLYEEFKDRGFAVLGFPCNQFGAQEPGSNEEISSFCSLRYRVTFPMFEKLEVNGDGRHALYRALIDKGGDITWNFEKFLIDRKGHIVERFDPEVKPEDPALRARIESALG